MTELPIADCFKEHYKKHNATFTNSERATIFWNSMLPRSEKLAALREIHSTTDDVELKSQIKERLDYEATSEKLFMSRDSNYVHLVYLDDSDRIDRVFSSVDAAIDYGKAECEGMFRVKKEILDDLLAPDADERTMLGGAAEFQKDGTMISCFCYISRERMGVLLNTVVPERFEEAYIPVLNPFEYGDIVRIMGDDRPAIVVTSQKRWDASLERIKNSKMQPLNYYVNTITVEFLYEDGEFSHGHPDIFALEKIERWDNEREWELLKSISDLMKGAGWIEPVFESYQKNRQN